MEHYFLAAHKKALKNITHILPDIQIVILDMSDVSMIDMTAIVALESIVAGVRKP